MVFSKWGGEGGNNASPVSLMRSALNAVIPKIPLVWQLSFLLPFIGEVNDLVPCSRLTFWLQPWGWARKSDWACVSDPYKLDCLCWPNGLGSDPLVVLHLVAWTAQSASVQKLTCGSWTQAFGMVLQILEWCNPREKTDWDFLEFSLNLTFSNS